MEALRLKQKPRSRGASVLFVALDWWPGRGSTINPVTREAALIQALREHGAQWDGPEIAANMVRTDAYCTSYQDTGTLTVADSSAGSSFHTAFIRPDRLLLEGKPMGKRGFAPFLLFKNHRGALWGDPSRRLTQEASLYGGIYEAGGVSEIVPYLLCRDELPGSGFDYSDEHLIGTTVIDGGVCYHMVSIRTGTGYSIGTYFVNSKTFLIRRVTTSTVEGKGITITYQPAVNMPIRRKVFQIHANKYHLLAIQKR